MKGIEEIYLIHHTHTDIGYTHDQPVLWDLQRRHISIAIDLAQADKNVNEPHAFRWTVETTAPLLHWLSEATEKQIEQLIELESAGRIEITGMFVNATPLYSRSELVESLRPVEVLRDEYGFDIRHAMNCDVNGHNWPLVDILLDAGIEGFTMAINEHFGGAPLERPAVFQWEGPSGRTISTLNGYHYMAGLHLGIGRNIEEFRDVWWPHIQQHLAATDYPLPVLPLQTTHPFGDNAPGYSEYRSFIRTWNSQEAVTEGNLPLIRMVTPSDWWGVVSEYSSELPTYRGDWTDFWIFGSISSAREQSINRESRDRLTTADAFEAGLTGLGYEESTRPPTRRSASRMRDKAWTNLMLFDEHTWGADTAVSVPNSDDSIGQWNHKANYAYTARSQSLLRQRDALAELSRQVSSLGESNAK